MLSGQTFSFEGIIPSWLAKTQHGGDLAVPFWNSVAERFDTIARAD
jgi:hypothetical protein